MNKNKEWKETHEKKIKEKETLRDASMYEIQYYFVSTFF